MNQIKERKIYNVLISLKDDITKSLELKKYDIESIIEIAIKYKVLDSLILLFQPTIINGEMRIVFDPFSTDILERLNNTSDSEEQAQIDALEEYERIQEDNSKLSDELREFYQDTTTYEELLTSKVIMPDQMKEEFFKRLFTIDFEKLNQIKIKNSHARQVSGWGHPIKTPKDVIRYMEPACLKTGLDLFNKNIFTTMNDTENVLGEGPFPDGICKIWIRYNSLSEDNKGVMEELITLGQAQRFMDGDTDTISIFVPCSGEDTVGDVSHRLQLLESKLKNQDILYGRGTPEEVYDRFKPIISHYPFYAAGCFEDGITVRGIIKLGQNLGYDMIYDEEEGLIWDYLEYYDKHKKYLLKHQNENNSQK